MNNMKATTTVNLDVEVLAWARENLGNLSGWMNNVIKERMAVSGEISPSKEAEFQKAIESKSSELAVLKEKLKEIEEQKVDNERRVVIGGDKRT